MSGGLTYNTSLYEYFGIICVILGYLYATFHQSRILIK